MQTTRTIAEIAAESRELNAKIEDMIVQRWSVRLRDGRRGVVVENPLNIRSLRGPSVQVAFDGGVEETVCLIDLAPGSAGWIGSSDLYAA